MKGLWQEKETGTASLKGRLENGTLVIDSSNYSRTDHYSPKVPIRYNFNTITLKLLSFADTVFLTGEVSLFSPQRNEPSKPTIIALVKTEGQINTETKAGQILPKHIKNDDSLPGNENTKSVRLLKVYPNPFSSFINISLEVVSADRISISLYAVNGQQVYYKAPEYLKPGIYAIKIIPVNVMQGQTYLLRLGTENGTSTDAVKLIKK